MPKRKRQNSRATKRPKKPQIGLMDILSNPGLDLVKDLIFQNLGCEDLENCRLVSKSVKQSVDSSRVFYLKTISELRQFEKAFTVDSRFEAYAGTFERRAFIEERFPVWADIFDHFEAKATFDEFKIFIPLIFDYFEDKTVSWDWLTPAHYAVIHGDLAFLKLMRKLPENIPISDGYHCTFLYLAVKSGKMDVIKFMLETEHDVDRKSEHGSNYGWTPLMAACRYLSLGKVKTILQLFRKRNVDVTEVNKYYETIFHLGALNPDVKVIKYLVKSCPEIDINQVEDRQQSLAHYVAKSKQPQKCEFLLKSRNELGLDFNTFDYNNTKPISHAIVSGHIPTLKVFLKHLGIQCVNPPPIQGTPFLIAAEYASLDTIKFLVNSGVDPYALDFWQKTTLMYALKNKDIKVIEYLLDKCKDMINMDALTGETFLHCVVEQGRVDVLKYILDKCDHKDFDFNIAEVEQERTILHLACEKNQEEIVKLLLESNEENCW